MPFTLITGTFHPEKGVPDGDSVRFEADDLDLLRTLEDVEIKADDTVQLRYEGIDAVEKNAKPADAKAAVTANLRALGTNAKSPKPTRGYILTRMADANGRPVSFVYAGEPEEEDGASIMLKTERLMGSVNYGLVRSGMAYPVFYETLFKELRDVLDAAYEQPLTAKIGIIKRDRSNEWVRYSGGNNAGLAKLPPDFPEALPAPRRVEQNLAGRLPRIDREEREGARAHTVGRSFHRF